DATSMPLRPIARPRQRWRLLGIVLAFATALTLAHRPMLVRFAHAFRVDDAMPSDALVLLLGGNDDRPQKAADLFRRGYAPLILMGFDPDTTMNRDSLLAKGVPSSAIRVLGPVDGTHDEALRVRAFARQHRLRSLTLVTTAYHSARAQWTFRRVLGPD